MIVDPDRYLADFKAVGAEVLTVHIEACTHLHRTIHAIKELGMKAGVAVNPHTSISLLEDLIEDIDLVCLMGVNPGFGGQKFIRKTIDKCAALSKMIQTKKANCLIEIDGGVNEETAKELIAAGANVLVAGNYVFAAKDPMQAVATIKAIR